MTMLWWALGEAIFVPRALLGAKLNMVHPLGDIRDLDLLVSNQEILYVSIYKSMYTLWHPVWGHFDHVTTIWANSVEYHKVMFHTKYQNFGAFCFLARIFLMYSLNNLLIEENLGKL